MRKECKNAINVTIKTQQGYHATEDYSRNYAFSGFESNKYFGSDRYEKLDENWKRANGLPLCGYGVEYETENNTIKNEDMQAEILDKIVFPYFPADLFKIQHDGSLSYGNEIITQVMTREFIRNNYKSFKVMYDDYFPALGFSCSRTGNCGMHVNISNACFGKAKETIDECIRKLVYIVNLHFNVMCRMTRRNPNNTFYCGRMTASPTPEWAKGINLDNLSERDTNHHICMNLAHYSMGRIELRFPAGQKNFAEFRNTMETIFFLVDRVKSISWRDCKDIAKVFSGCNSYVLSRCDKVRAEGFITAEDYEKIRANAVEVNYI